MPRHGIPILLYHGLWTDPEQLRERASAQTRYWLHAQTFEEHVNGFAACGYEGKTLRELLNTRGQPAQVKTMVLTFDDGWASDWRLATPILQRFGWKAEFFVTAGWMGKPGFMTWDEVREAAAAGMSIQSHSLTHPDLGRLSVRDIRYELEASKGILEEQLGRPVEFFALPGGSGRQREIRRLARAAGYRGVCTSDVGLNAPQGDPFCWLRIPVLNTTTFPQLAAWAQGHGLRALRWRRTAFRLARGVCGPAAYEWLKAKLMRPSPVSDDSRNSLFEV